jgi:hypothetical protein
MPRTSRAVAGGVLNRANGRLRLFKKDGDHLAFETFFESVSSIASRTSSSTVGVINKTIPEGMADC